MRAMAETTLGSQSHRLILGFVPLSPLVFACIITHLPNEQEESHPKMEVANGLQTGTGSPRDMFPFPRQRGVTTKPEERIRKTGTWEGLVKG